MRYLTPAVLAALMIAGCACNRPQEAPQPEPVPLLQDIPVLGEKFQPAPEPAEPVTTQVTSKDIPLLSDIPILGHLFKRRVSEQDK